MAAKKLRDENNEIDKAENEINRRMAEGYKTGGDRMYDAEPNDKKPKNKKGASEKSKHGRWMTITSPDGKQKIRAFVFPK